MQFGWSFERTAIWSLSGKKRFENLTTSSMCGIDSPIQLDKTAFGFFFPHFQNKYNIWAYRAVGPSEHMVYPIMEAKAYPYVVQTIMNAVRDLPNDDAILQIDPGLVYVVQDALDAEIMAMNDDYFSNIPTRERRMQEVATIVKVKQMIDHKVEQMIDHMELEMKYNTRGLRYKSKKEPVNVSEEEIVNDSVDTMMMGGYTTSYVSWAAMISLAVGIGLLQG
jgi:hypothetical protein